MASSHRKMLFPPGQALRTHSHDSQECKLKTGRKLHILFSSVKAEFSLSTVTPCDHQNAYAFGGGGE